MRCIIFKVGRCDSTMQVSALNQTKAATKLTQTKEFAMPMNINSNFVKIFKYRGPMAQE